MVVQLLLAFFWSVFLILKIQSWTFSSNFEETCISSGLIWNFLGIHICSQVCYIYQLGTPEQLSFLASSMTMQPFILFLLFLTILSFQSTSAVEFAFKSFNTSQILLYSNAKLESSAISLTQNTRFSIGRALYHSKIPTRLPKSSTLLPFRISFTFSITPYKNQLPGHGLVFFFVPSTGTAGASSAQHLGFLNRTNDGNPDNHVFGIEFDVFQNQEFSDINDNHVGVDVNSLTSVASHKAGYWVVEGDAKNSHNKTNWSFHELKLKNGAIYRAWIEYVNNQLTVTMAPSNMKKPERPLINASLDLSKVFVDEMYIGFCAATGQLVENHKILSWSFSN